VFDLDRYLERIGLSGRPTLAELHRAHVTAIPFENLDPHRGAGVSLELEDLQRKFLDERRGGYCFEQNLLLKAAAEALGASVQPMLARVRLHAPAGTIRPRTHLVLRIEAEGESWHADAGFGSGTPLEPLPFGPGAEHDQAGWRFRVVEEGEELVLQTFSDGDWADLYAFLPQPVPHVDIETSNWFTSAHPHSPFVTGLRVSSQDADGRRTILSDWDELALTEQTPASLTTTPVEPAQIPGLLAERFELEGFVLDADGRVVRGGGGELALL
jgi:N-hydroxyarylamine O-acetyltransferase